MSHLLPLPEQQRKHVYDIAEVIEENPDQLCMQIWGLDYELYGEVIVNGVTHKCGTSHCIGGWSDVLADGDTIVRSRRDPIMGTDPRALVTYKRMGMTADQGKAICWDRLDEKDKLGAEEVARILRIGADYGWDTAIKSFDTAIDELNDLPIPTDDPYR